MDELRAAYDALSALRIPASFEESALAALAADALSAARIAYKREVPLRARVRVDFLLEGGVVVELKKLRPPRAALLRQLERYAACAQVSALLLVAPSSVSLPPLIGGKPVAMLPLRRLWGVAAT